MTEVIPQALPDVLLIVAKKFGDARGYFMETYSHRRLEAAGFSGAFVQDNQSFTAAVGTVRGLHFQAPPHAQAKLVRVTRGAILDVCVDIRRGSPTFGQHVTAELSADNNAQLLVPVGFAHGFQTLVPDCEVLYKVTDFYAPQAEGGLIWNDPALGIPWPIDADRAALNARDASWPRLADLNSPFSVDGTLHNVGETV
jgi:dTDP-4-dehydrorhamnose 3,5-epimerase